MAEQKRESIVRWAQVEATLFLGVVGLVFTYVINLQQAKNRSNQMALQIMSQREQSEIDFRQKMFGVLINEFLNSKIDVRDRVIRLKLFQQNFHGIFNARALFDVLEKEASYMPTPQRDDVIYDLVSIAKEVTVTQELLVGSKSKIFTMKEGDIFFVNLNKLEKGNHENGENHTNRNEKGHVIAIKLIKVKEIAIEIEVIIDNDKARMLEYKVSFFDAPLTDNTLLPDKHRFAVTLKETNMEAHPREATLSVFEFPADYITTGYRPSIRETNKMFKNIQ